MFLQDFMAKNRFLHILTRFYTLKTAKNLNQSLWIVYGSIILNFFWWLRTPIRTSDSTAKIIEEKKFFWDTLLYSAWIDPQLLWDRHRSWPDLQCCHWYPGDSCHLHRIGKNSKTELQD